MARYRKKIENERVIGGELGRRILSAFLRDGIVTLEGNFYFLIPERLNEHLGMDWVALRKHQTSEKFDQYLRRL